MVHITRTAAQARDEWSGEAVGGGPTGGKGGAAVGGGLAAVDPRVGRQRTRRIARRGGGNGRTLVVTGRGST